MARDILIKERQEATVRQATKSSVHLRSLSQGFPRSCLSKDDE